MSTTESVSSGNNFSSVTKNARMPSPLAANTGREAGSMNDSALPFGPVVIKRVTLPSRW